MWYLKLFTLFLLQYLHVGNADNLAYTTISYGNSGKPCLNDCDGVCYVGHKELEACTKGYKKPPTYYTSLYNDKIPHCLSRCDFYGYKYSWCYVKNDYSWDYCNPDTTDTTQWFQYTLTLGRCRDECATRGYDYYWCHTVHDSWDKCETTWYYEEVAKTKDGDWCYGKCFTHEGKAYYWCYNKDQFPVPCAKSAVYYQCPNERPKPNRVKRQNRPPHRLVADYNNAINNDPRLTTARFLQNTQSPILEYTYRDLGLGFRLPYRIRARITPTHLRASNSRQQCDIASNARRNCETMGMNRNTPNNNDDQRGHLIPYILGGPGDWYNVVPQTRRINIGTVSNTDILSPSVWGYTERTLRRWVEDGGTAYYDVLVAYDGGNTRPSGFGTIERRYDRNGVLQYDCPGYWYSNDPNADPDEWND